MLDVLFLKDKLFSEKLLADNLFISIDKSSALRHDYNKVLDMLKVHDSYEILFEDEILMEEDYTELLYIFKVQNNSSSKHLFARIVLVKDTLSDVLVYTLGDDYTSSEKNIEYYRNIFLKQRVKVSKDFIEFFDSIKEIKVAFTFENNRFRMHHETQAFLDLIDYEDWDYKNEFQNYLDFVMNPKTIEEIKQNLGQDINLNVVIDRHTEDKVYQLECRLTHKQIDSNDIYFLIVNN